LISAAYLFLSVNAAGAGMYQYTDDAGVRHFVDSEGKIPSRYRPVASPHTPAENTIHSYEGRNDSGPSASRNAGPGGKANGPAFWKRRKYVLEKKVLNLKSDCDFWRANPPQPDENAIAAAARERGTKQCDRLVKARQDLDSLASEIKRQGGSPSWLSD
jgi:hypothetical protein